MEQIIAEWFLPLSEDLISRFHDQCRKRCFQSHFIDYYAITLQIVLWVAAMWFEYLNKITWLVFIIVCLHTGHEMVKTQATAQFFFLTFNLLNCWHLSIRNCCKPVFPLLYNCQLLFLCRLAISIAVQVFPQPVFHILLLQGHLLQTCYA